MPLPFFFLGKAIELHRCYFQEKLSFATAALVCSPPAIGATDGGGPRPWIALPNHPHARGHPRWQAPMRSDDGSPSTSACLGLLGTRR
jgi:hypothetical protein